MYIRALATPREAVDDHQSVLSPQLQLVIIKLNMNFGPGRVAPKLPWALKVCQMRLRFGLLLDPQIGYGYLLS